MGEGVQGWVKVLISRPIFFPFPSLSETYVFEK